jgi:hypothetical protein
MALWARRYCIDFACAAVDGDFAVSGRPALLVVASA